MRPHLIYLFLFLVYSSCEIIPQKERVSTLVQESSLGSIHFEKGDKYRYSQQYGKAIKAYRRVLDTQRDLRPIDSAYGCNQIAYLYLITYQEHLAKPWLELSEHLMNRTPTVPTTMQAAHRFNLGRYHYLSFSLQDARALAHESRVLYDSLGYGKHLRMAQIYDLLSLIHIEDGILTDSASYYAKVAQGIYYSHPSLIPFSAESDFTLGRIGYMYRAHQRGEYYSRSALSKIRESPEPIVLLEARCWNLLGNLLKKQGDAFRGNESPEAIALRDSFYQEADHNCFGKAIQLTRNSPSIRPQQFFRDRVILATRYPDKGKFFTYLRDLNSRLKEQEDILGHPERLLGYMYFDTKPDSSLFFYQKFLKKIEHSNSYTEIHLVDEGHFSLRELYLKEKDYENALYHVTNRLESYKCCKKGISYFDPEKLKGSLSTKKTFCLLKYADIARILMRQYSEKGTLSYLLLANTYYQLVAENYYGSILNPDEDALLTFQLEAGKHLFTSAYEAALLTWEETQHPKWLDLAFRYIEFTKANALIRNMKQPMSAEEEKIVLTDSIRILQSKVNQFMFQFTQDNDQEKDKLLQNWQQAQMQLNQWNDTLRKTYKAWQGFESASTPTTIENVQQVLGSQEALVQYFVGRNVLYGIYVDSDIVFPFVADGLSQIDSLVKSYRSSLMAKNYSISVKQTYISSANNLYHILIKPFEKLLQSKKQLLVIPDGSLNQVPFEAFLTESVESVPKYFSSLPYFINSHSLSYSPSWKLSRKNHIRNLSLKNTERMGVWIDPSIESSLLKFLDTMEISPTIFHTTSFGKEHFLQDHSQYDIIHLTTHAKSDGLNRLNNKIFFGNREEDELFGFELANKNFQCQLLVLAACETALGPNMTGEGTFSLTRSFLQVGVPQVVSTLWEVKQGATDEVLIQFYKNLFQTNSPVPALSEAKRQFIKKADTRAQFPGYWAGIMITN